MTVLTFPVLPGQGWSTKVTPLFSTRIASHVSGREVRASLFVHPLYQFELTFDGLDSLGKFVGLTVNSQQTLLGFYLKCGGQFGSFVYVDPENNAVANQNVGTGDGVTTSFTASRTIGGFTEPVGYVTNTPVVSVAGAIVSGWVLAEPNTITFATPPASGAAITASYSYGFLCRFLDDQEEFEEFMSGLWKIDSLKFRSIR